MITANLAVYWGLYISHFKYLNLCKVNDHKLITMSGGLSFYIIMSCNFAYLHQKKKCPILLFVSALLSRNRASVLSWLGSNFRACINVGHLDGNITHNNSPYVMHNCRWFHSLLVCLAYRCFTGLCMQKRQWHSKIYLCELEEEVLQLFVWHSPQNTGGKCTNFLVWKVTVQ